MNDSDAYFSDLTVIVESSFPRKCSCCGKTYATAKSFLVETKNMPSGRSSLKEAIEEDGTTIVEVFRNCVCGSTLMDEFNSRRDESIEGQKRRETFDRLLMMLQQQQIAEEVARAEVLKVLHGEHSEHLNLLLGKVD